MYTDVPNTIGSSTHIWHNNMCTKICNFTSKEKKLMCYKGTNSCLFCQSIYTLACLETISFDYAMSGLHLRLLPGYNRLVISKIIDDKCDHGSISRQICIPITSFYLSFCNNRQNAYLIFITDIQYQLHSCVTGFEKSQIPHIQYQDTLFTIIQQLYLHILTSN